MLASIPWKYIISILDIPPIPVEQENIHHTLPYLAFFLARKLAFSASRSSFAYHSFSRELFFHVFSRVFVRRNVFYMLI